MDHRRTLRPFRVAGFRRVARLAFLCTRRLRSVPGSRRVDRIPQAALQERQEPGSKAVRIGLREVPTGSARQQPQLGRAGKHSVRRAETKTTAGNAVIFSEKSPNALALREILAARGLYNGFQDVDRELVFLLSGSRDHQLSPTNRRAGMDRGHCRHANNLASNAHS